MRAFIAEWQIADGEIAIPLAGSFLDDLALRLGPGAQATSEDEVLVEGTITWARFDERNGLLESVIAAERFSVLTQDPATLEDPVPAVGTPVRRAGRLHSVGSYEVDAFGLPDVRQSWLVLAAERVGLDDLMVELEPR